MVVVDEAILALSNYHLADPLGAFYSDRPSYLQAIYSRASIVLVDPLALASNVDHARQLADSAKVMNQVMEAPAAAEMAGAPMPTQTAAPGNNATGTPILVRSDFNPLAAFAPDVRTDANGEAVVAIRLPDNLTRYRIMVVAVQSGQRFGSGESNLTARLPLMVRPSAPRFLNFGDALSCPWWCRTRRVKICWSVLSPAPPTWNSANL